MPRPWSASTRCAFVARGESPYATPDSAAIHSIAVKSNGAYGFDANVWAGMPVRTTAPGSYEVITGYAMDDFAKTKLAATNKELVDERAFVADMIK